MLTEFIVGGYAETCVDPCLSVNCGAHGVCNRFANGRCDCSDGFSGDRCDIEPICPRINYAAATSGGSVVASHTQNGYDIVEAIDGALAPADNGWAFGGGATRDSPRTAVFTFRSAAMIDTLEILSGIGRDDHHLAGMAVWYTTDATPLLPSEGGSWLPVTGLHWMVSVAGGSISGNELTMTGQQDLQIGMDPTLATGFRVDVFATSASNGNVVLTEMSVMGVENDRCIPSHCPRVDAASAALGGSVESSHTQGGFEVAESIDGIVVGSDNGWAYGGGASRDALKTAVYTLSERTVMDQIDVISGIDRTDHMVGGCSLFYTNDDVVGFGSQWTALEQIRDMDPVDGLEVVANEVTADGQHYVRLSFNPVTATGVKLELFDTNAGNGNVVLTEFIVGGYADRCAKGGDGGGH